MLSLADRYKQVKQRVADAAARAGTPPESVILVAVTKYAEPEDIRELIRLGHADFGESRVQQLVQRAAMIEEWLSRQSVMPATAARDADAAEAGSTPDAVRWHLIGHLQRNKARKAITVARLIHSVDSLRLAEEIQSLALKRDRVVDVLLQVNASGQKGKHGCAIPAAPHLAEAIETMLNVRLRGLMTMAPESENPEDSRPTFARLRELFEEIRAAGIGRGHFNILSMGMSNDFEIALAEGANVVRVGSAIFGQGAANETAESEDDDA